MAISIYSNSGNVNYGIKHYTVDTKEDLKKLPTNMKAGSTAFVADSSKTYRLNSTNEWKEDKSASVGGITPEGEKEINTNGIHDIEEYKTANVNVPVGVFPEGEEVITENGDYDITEKAIARVNVPVSGPTETKQINITANGTTTEDVSDYANAEIAVNTDPVKGVVYGDYDADGYPHSARFVGTWANIPDAFFFYAFRNDSFLKNVKQLSIPDTVTAIGTNAISECNGLESILLPHANLTCGQNAIRSCAKVKRIEFYKDVEFSSYGYQCTYDFAIESVIFNGNVNAIPNGCFRYCAKIALYDFSHCTTIPPLYSADSIANATGCVIRIPVALSDTTLGTGNGWESATNWSALTNIVWEVV